MSATPGAGAGAAAVHHREVGVEQAGAPRRRVLRCRGLAERALQAIRWLLSSARPAGSSGSSHSVPSPECAILPADREGGPTWRDRRSGARTWEKLRLGGRVSSCEEVEPLTLCGWGWSSRLDDNRRRAIDLPQAAGAHQASGPPTSAPSRWRRLRPGEALLLLNEILPRRGRRSCSGRLRAPDTGNAETIAHHGTPGAEGALPAPAVEGEMFSCYR